MKMSGAWGLSLGLLLEKVWPSFQTNKQSGKNGIHLLDAMPLAITPLATVSKSPFVINHYPCSPLLGPREGYQSWSNHHTEGN